MFIFLNCYLYILQIMCYVSQLSLTHASWWQGGKDTWSLPPWLIEKPFSSIKDIHKVNIIEITSMCFDDNTRHLDYEAIRHHLRFRYLSEFSKSLYRKIKEFHDGHPDIGPFGFYSYDVCKDPKKLSDVLAKIYLSPQHCWKPTFSCGCSSVLFIFSFLPLSLTKLAAKILTSFTAPYFPSIDYRGSNASPYITSNGYMYTSESLMYSDVNLILDTVRKYHINHILLAFSDRDEKSLQSNHQERIWEELIRLPDVCVEMMDLTASNGKNISFLIDFIKKKKKFKLIIIWPKLLTPDFAKQTEHIEDRIWFWYLDKHNIHRFEKPDCTFLLRHPLYYYYDIEISADSTFQKFYRQVSVNDTWINRFVNESRINSFNHFDVNKTMTGEHIDLLFSSLYGYPILDLYILYYDGYSWKCHLHEIARDIAITKSKYLKDVKEALSTRYCYTAQRKLCCKPIKCHPGSEPLKTTFTKRGFAKSFGWTCKKCPSDEVKLNYSTEKCNSCPGVTIPDKDQINCFDPYTDEFLAFTDYKSMIVLSVLIPFLTYNMGLIFVIGFRRKTPIIVASGSTSNIVQLCAHLLVSIELLVLHFGKLNDTKCTWQVLTTGILFTLILSLLLTQTQKTIYVFKAKIQISRNDVILTKVVQIFVSVVLIAIQILISVITYFQLTPTVKLTIDAKNLKRKVTCDNDLFFRAHFVYILILAILCSIQALRARNLPKYFTATAEIGYSMYITVVVIMVRFPILSSEKVVDKNFANALFIIVLNSIPMVIRYTKTCYTLIFHPEKNTKEYVRNILLKNVRQKTEEQIAERNRQNTSEECNENRINKDK